MNKSFRWWKEVIWAPEYYWKMDFAEHKVTCNGAGAAEGTKFPNTFYGLSLRPAFDVHDKMYKEGKTKKDKFEADATMFLNCIKIVDWKGGFLKLPRVYRAASYYIAVHYKGDKAFWKGKVRPNRGTATSG